MKVEGTPAYHSKVGEKRHKQNDGFPAKKLCHSFSFVFNAPTCLRGYRTAYGRIQWKQLLGFDSRRESTKEARERNYYRCSVWFQDCTGSQARCAT